MVTGRASLDLIVVCLVARSYAPAGQYLCFKVAVVWPWSVDSAAPGLPHLTIVPLFRHAFMVQLSQLG